MFAEQILQAVMTELSAPGIGEQGILRLTLALA